MRRFASILIAGAALAGLASTAWAQGTGPGRYFPETGHSLDARFVDYYDVHGGLAILGYPITDAFVEPSSGWVIQYFQNARIELVPDPGTNTLQPKLSPLGEWMGGWDPVIDDGQGPLGAGAGCRFFAESGHKVCHAFLDFYDARGGPGTFGFPISEFKLENERIIQYFQGFRLDWYPDSPDAGLVRIAPLGRLHFEAMGYDSVLLRPNMPSNMLLYRVVELHPQSSVDRAIVGPSDTERVFVVVRDQNANPVGGAAVTLVAHFSDGEQTFVMPQTDERGISQVDLSFQDQTRGANVDLEVWAVWRGELQAVTRDSFRIWW